MTVSNLPARRQPHSVFGALCMLDSPCNDPGSISGLGGAVGIWVYCACGSTTSSARDIKQGCRLFTDAFKIMHGR